MKPIIFNTEMVKAILDGNKTQTRRPIKHFGNGFHYGKLLCDWSLSDNPEKYHKDMKLWGAHRKPVEGEWVWELQCDVDDSNTSIFKCPFGKIGDKLWVRETFCIGEYPEDGEIWYKANKDDLESFNESETHKWRPSIHMPRWASRITLEITDIRVERVQDISVRDAWEEGLRCKCMSPTPICKGNIEEFKKIWDSIYSKNGFSWNSNPWVWVIEFKIIKEVK